MFKKFLIYVEAQFQVSVKKNRLDSRGEYMSHEFHDYLQPKGVLSIYPSIIWDGSMRESLFT